MSRERIQEERINGEIHYRLVLTDGTIGCTIDMLGYELLLYIGSTQKRKGYGRRLYNHVETVARQHGMKILKTDDIDVLSEGAVGFFKAMGFILKPIDSQFLEGEKTL